VSFSAAPLEPEEPIVQIEITKIEDQTAQEVIEESAQ